ncbi:MAG: hypothetical protein COX07_01870 [Bacteroidetes bacterium CG23_combo_of_CG06-09_8_20_14_all_32_9]|nr:MAG: hypothetical protein COX07_01870 [Bacteroidetes bacterium CG23_combo_of_CG06-09_8_20_14_all_32_9]
MKTTVKNNQEMIEKSVKYDYTYSNHSKKRSSQRGINDETIQLALCYGKEFFKQGLIFIAVQTKLVPDYISGSLKKKLKNLVIVLAGDSDELITCYKTSNSVKYITKKTQIHY